MAEAKHTPGPWWIDDENSVGAGDQVIAVVKPVSHRILRSIDQATWNANANLIAAAPELYEALCEILSIDVTAPEGGHEEVREIHGIARAAIAKATS